MSGIEFNREAVGISAKKDWKDSETFGRIGQFITTLPAAGVANDLPVGDNVGVGALRKTAGQFAITMNMILEEYSDACATLGSGQEEAISNYDQTEFQATDNFREMVSRMEG